MNDRRPIEYRLERIERAIAELSAEVASIRSALGASDSSEAEASVPVKPRRLLRKPQRLASHDLERLVGSYGMLAIAVLAAVGAVGTFLSWAISHGFLTIGPAARVAIGLAFASAIGVWGMRLRQRERSFGSSLLGLALVIVHVCAYAAGPSFELVPTWVAFLGAAIASCALTVFAHSEVDEPLWCVGFGGAAIAPFVTSNGHGSVYALLAYGTLVLLSGCYSINKREWPVAWIVFYLASALFVGASGWEARNIDTTHFILALAFPLTIAVAGIAPLVIPSRKRGAIRWMSLLVALTGAYREAGSGHHIYVEVGALVGSLIICLVLVDSQSDVDQSSLLAFAHPLVLDWIDAFLLPVLFTIEAALAIETIGPWWVVAAMTSVILVAFVTRTRLGGLRDASALGAVSIAIAAALSISSEPVRLCATLVAIALAALAMHKFRPSRAWLQSAGAAFGYAVMTSLVALSANSSQYHDDPFARPSSASALIVLIGLVIVARSWRTIRVATRASYRQGLPRRRVSFERRTLRITTISPWIWGFVWVLLELRFAFSATAAMLLLVTYFAATAVGCVAVGRWRSSSRLRQIGLALAIVSAATAVYGAHAYFDFGARIVAYLVTSAFLLGIAYWYRRPGPAPSPAAAH
jgi:hypothetical protein